MKKLIFLAASSLLLVMGTINVSAQKRPPAKAPTPTAKPTPIPKATSPADALFKDGLKCAAEDYDCQVSNYTKAINLGLKTKEVFRNRGNAYLKRKDFDKGLADFSKLIELDPNDTSGYKNRGKIYLESGTLPQSVNAAIRDFTSAIDLEPKDKEALILRSRAHFTAGNNEKGLSDLDSAVQLDPTNTSLLIFQGKVFSNLENYNKAIDSYSKVISSQPNNIEAFIGRANVYQLHNKNDLAIRDYSKAAELDPRNPDPRISLASIFEKDRKYEDAIKEYSKAIEQNPTNSDFLFKRAELYRKLKKTAEASADATKVLELSPQNARAFEFRCGVEQEIGNIIKAVEDCSIAIALDLNVDDAYINRYQIFQSRILLNGSQWTAPYDRFLGDLELGTKNKRIVTGIQLRRDPTNSDYYFRLAQAEELSGLPYLAESHFSDAIRIDPLAADAYAGRARTRFMIHSAAEGNIKKVDGYLGVLKDYSRAQELDSSNEIVLSSLQDHFKPVSDHQYAEFYPIGLEFLDRLILSNPRDPRPLIARALLRNDILNIESVRPFIGNYNGVGINKRSQKLKDEDWNGTKTSITQDLQRASELCGNLDRGKLSRPLFVASIYFNDLRPKTGYGPQIVNLVKECNKRSKSTIRGQSGIDELQKLYAAVETGNRIAQSLNAGLQPSSVSRADSSIREQEVNRVERENAERDKLASAKLEAYRRDALKYQQEVAATQERINRQKEQRNAETMSALFGLITTTAEALSNNRRPTSQSTQPNTPTSQQTSQAAGTSSVGSTSTNQSSSGRHKYIKDPVQDMSSVRMGEKADEESFTGCSTDTLYRNMPQLKHCWGAWQQSPLSQIQFRVQGPVGRGYNAINDEPDKRSFQWYAGLKNTSSAIVYMKYAFTTGDGKEHSWIATLGPGQYLKLNDSAFVTFSNSPNISFRFMEYEICSDVSRIPYAGGHAWQCNEK